MRNEALELVKNLRKLLDQVDPQYIKWDALKKEMDDLIEKEEAREAQPAHTPNKPSKRPELKCAKKPKVAKKATKKKGGSKDIGGLDYGPPSGRW